jgi:hypothetical protein
MRRRRRSLPCELRGLLNKPQPGQFLICRPQGRLRRDVREIENIAEHTVHGHHHLSFEHKRNGTAGWTEYSGYFQEGRQLILGKVQGVNARRAPTGGAGSRRLGSESGSPSRRAARPGQSGWTTLPARAPGGGLAR